MSAFLRTARDLRRLPVFTAQVAKNLAPRLRSYRESIQAGSSAYDTARTVGVTVDQVLDEVSAFARMSSTRPSGTIPRGWGDAASAAAVLAAASDAEIERHATRRRRLTWTGHEQPTVADVMFMAQEMRLRGTHHLCRVLRELGIDQQRRPPFVFADILDGIAESHREMRNAARHLTSPKLATRIKWAEKIRWAINFPDAALRDERQCRALARTVLNIAGSSPEEFFSHIANAQREVVWARSRGYQAR